MATLTAVAAGGTWGTAATWSPAQVPTASDDVVLASTSGNVTIAATAACRSLDCTGYTGTLTHNNNVAMTIGTTTTAASGIALKFVSGMTYAPGNSGATINFTSTSSTTQTIDYGGKTTIGSTMTFASSTGAARWQWLSGLTQTAMTWNLNGGTLDLNGQTFSISIFNSTGAITRSLVMGASSITLAATAGWTVSGSNLSITPGTSSITMSGAGATFTGGGYTYNNYSTTTTGTTLMNGANTFNNVTITGNSTTAIFNLAASQTITGTLTLNGTSTSNRLRVQSSVFGTQVTLTAAAISCSYVDFADIVGAGAASWSLASITGLSGDGGNNSGITFTTGISQTMTLTATVNWSAYAWSTRIPLPQDDVTVVNNSGTTRFITFDLRNIGRNISFAGVANTVSITGSVRATVYGDWTGASNVTVTTSQVNFNGRGSQVITSNGCSFFNLVVDCGNGTVQLADTATVGNGGTTHNTGTLDLNGQTLTTQIYVGNGGTSTKVLSFKGGIVNCVTTAATTFFTAGSTANMTCTNLTSGSAIVLSTASTNQRDFTASVGNATLPTLRYVVAGSTGALTISANNTFTDLDFQETSSVGRTLKIQAGSTQTFTNSFTMIGSPTVAANLDSISAATHTINIPSGVTTNCNHLIVTHSIATGGGGFYAGADSADGGSNTGWFFTAPPTPLTKNQTAISRIAITTSKNQTAIARIAKTLGKTQTAVSRIAKALSKTQTATARIARTMTPWYSNFTFDCNTTDGTKFASPYTGSWPSSWSISSGKLHIPVENIAVNDNQGDSQNNYSLAGSMVTLEVDNIPTGTDSGTSARIALVGPDSNDIIRLDLKSDSTYQTAVGNQIRGVSGTSGTYDPVAMKFLRLRNTTSNVVLFEGSPDGLTWTQFDSQSGATSITDNYMQLACFYSGTSNATGDFVIDNINLGVVRTKTQTAISRIAITSHKDQTALARIAKTLSKIQTATASIMLSSTGSKTQTAISRIALRLTKNQTAKARIAGTLTKIQTATASIILSGIGFANQNAKARIAVAVTKTQLAKASIALRFTKDQTAKARIAETTTKIQTATASIIVGNLILTKIQTAKARIVISVTNTLQQTATARIIYSYKHTKIQTATACISMAVFEPPTINANSPTYPNGINDRAYPVSRQANALFRWYKARPVGQTIIGNYNNDTYEVGREFSSDKLAQARVVYQGGHKYPVTGAEYARLVAAGFEVRTGVTQI